jgi:hypothetical protein
MAKEVVLVFLMVQELVIVEPRLTVLLLLISVWLDISLLGINIVPLQNMDVIHNGIIHISFNYHNTFDVNSLGSVYYCVIEDV